MNLIARVLFILMGMHVVAACEFFRIEPKCGPFDNSPFKISAIHHTMVLHDRENNRLYESPRDFIGSHEFGVLLEIEKEKIAYSDQTDFSFIQSAYACSPPPLQLNGQIDSLAIYSNVPYQDELTTSDNLVSLFDMVEVRIYSDSYDADTQLPAENISEYFTSYYYDSPQSIYLFLTEPPSGELPNISFRVIIYLSGDGIQTAEFTTEPVTLIP